MGCSRSPQSVLRGKCIPSAHAQQRLAGPALHVPAAGALRLFPRSHSNNNHTRHTTHDSLNHTPLLPLHPHAASPFSVLAFSRRASFFCLRADALNLSFICRSPPRYSQVHTNTTAKLKKMYAHIMPVCPMLACITIKEKTNPHLPKSLQIYRGNTLNDAANASPVAY